MNKKQNKFFKPQIKVSKFITPLRNSENQQSKKIHPSGLKRMYVLKMENKQFRHTLKSSRAFSKKLASFFVKTIELLFNSNKAIDEKQRQSRIDCKSLFTNSFLFRRKTISLQR